MSKKFEWPREVSGMEHPRTRIHGVDVISIENEVWFVQQERVCWVDRRDIWNSLSRVAPALKQRGYDIDIYHFPKKLREFIVSVSRAAPGILVEA